MGWSACLDTPDGSGLATAETRARLCLLAVLPNLGDVFCFDPEMAELAKTVDASVEIAVPGLPSLFIELAGGSCRAQLGSLPSGRKPDATVAFASAQDLNRSFLNSGAEFPEQALNGWGFFRQQLPRLRDRLVTYLERGEVTPDDPVSLNARVQLKLHVAAFAVPVLLECDPQACLFRSALGNGSILLRVMPDGPSAGLRLRPDRVLPVRDDVARPTAAIFIHDLHVANAFLDRRLDSCVAIARGDIESWGQIPTVDALSMVLDRIPAYF